MSAAGEAKDPLARWAKPRPAGRVSARAGEPRRNGSRINFDQRGSRSACRRAIDLADIASVQLTETAQGGQA